MFLAFGRGSLLKTSSAFLQKGFCERVFHMLRRANFLEVFPRGRQMSFLWLLDETKRTSNRGQDNIFLRGRPSFLSDPYLFNKENHKHPKKMFQTLQNPFLHPSLKQKLKAKGYSQKRKAKAKKTDRPSKSSSGPQ